MARMFYRQIAAEDLAVRALLAEMRGWLATLGIGEERCGAIEIGLAEALNNVVEHAYANAPGEIAVDMRLAADGLRVILCDRGAPLPRQRLPAAAAPPTPRRRAALPEGGFGWHLIRSVARDVDYARAGDRNCLTLVFDIMPGATWSP
ncbi:MAG: ATP-binding protein [Roseovarius sp.]|nr:ATP-binding protein [Roseovarius sp.]